jgi:hypothetical protein
MSKKTKSIPVNPMANQFGMITVIPGNKGKSYWSILLQALAEALQKHNWNFELAFQDYNKILRPFIEEVQAEAEFNVREKFIPATEEAIRKRNIEEF